MSADPTPADEVTCTERHGMDDRYEVDPHPLAACAEIKALASAGAPDPMAYLLGDAW